MKTKRTWRIVLIVAIALALAAAGFYFYKNQPSSAQAPEEPVLQTATVRRGDLVISATASACSCGDRHPSRTQARPSVSPNQRTAQSGIANVNHPTDSTFARLVDKETRKQGTEIVSLASFPPRLPE